MGWRKFCSAASHPYGKQYKAAFRKSIFPSQIPYLINGDPKGSLQEAAHNILEQIFLSPAIPTNYNLTTSTQPPDPPFSPQEISAEKLMTQSLTYHLESTNNLNDRQHGFREGKSVDTSINELLRNIKTARIDGKHVLVLSIDIKGVFDNLQHRAILKTLDASACPSNINRLFHSLLQNRKVTLLTPQGRATKEQKQGCPQGSCSGPALWNLVANEILNQVWPDNVHIQAFADDFVLVIKADTNKSLVEDTQNAITQFSSWCAENELAISTEKTNYTLFSKMVRCTNITWNGYKINRVKSFKYLGIHVDDRLNWYFSIKRLLRECWPTDLQLGV
ncbi:Retrovirus-related Pol polyprotein from type-1 retrotransposable element R1 [Araneus ventricosus]|uniref:Retrovirus-related Pol polyprotein from type-1 retrotransposable element R1 n=1 Tax=Araneus ventricosus TaxID=182803 RepID=A0A4Y2K520_ARAVE|nr:Retrovirus-related Pol polyprotein from type-1 retrotransposable element R1 [Araneus ventricosus]